MTFFITPLIQTSARAFRHAHRSSFLCHPTAAPRIDIPVPLTIERAARELVTNFFTASILNFTLRHSILFFVEELFGVGVGWEGQRRRMRLEDHPDVSRLLRLVLVAVVKWAIDSNAGFLFVVLCAVLVCYLKSLQAN